MSDIYTHCWKVSKCRDFSYELSVRKWNYFDVEQLMDFFRFYTFMGVKAFFLCYGCEMAIKIIMQIRIYCFSSDYIKGS